jgi:hypothetical protein
MGDAVVGRIESSEVMDALDRYIDALHEQAKRSSGGDRMRVCDQVLPSHLFDLLCRIAIVCVGWGKSSARSC